MLWDSNPTRLAIASKDAGPMHEPLLQQSQLDCVDLAA